MEKMSGSPTGPSVRFVSASLPTRMIVVKLGDGSLWINSPVAVWGLSSNLPLWNAFHNLFLGVLTSMRGGVWGDGRRAP